jgi:hypothetical protein
MSKLHRKKVDYIGLTKEHMAKKDVHLSKVQILWILKRFTYYVLKVIIHGFTMIIPGNMRFTMYHVNSSDFNGISKEARYASSGAIHGVFFSIKCEGKFPDEYKTEFKPLLKFRSMMEECLDEPDLAYKLIT